MRGTELRAARRGAGVTQERLAQLLGVTQGYVSLLEKGRRVPSPRLTRKVCRVLGLPPTSLPVTTTRRGAGGTRPEWVVRCLANLDYPGYAFRKAPGRRVNPAEVLLRTLAQQRVAPRLFEAMPWLLLTYGGFDHKTLVGKARELGVQNRLGFVAALARAVARSNQVFEHRATEMESLQSALELHRLANEDALGQDLRSERLRAWVKAVRTSDAAHWNLLTALAPEQLPYAN